MEASLHSARLAENGAGMKFPNMHVAAEEEALQLVLKLKSKYVNISIFTTSWRLSVFVEA